MKTILTNNLKKATKVTMQTIKNNEMCVISGHSGMGKTTFREMLLGNLLKEKYQIAYYVPFKKIGTQTNRILTIIYEVLFPEQHIPVNENKKLNQIKSIAQTIRLVLVIDNMQNLDIQTIREIKIIHKEIKTLSVIFFLKNGIKILNLLEEVEIGQRVNHYNRQD
ncbi:MAG: ATP-binding protein [Leptospiraceae bacterium]|nr:ATP-binding protein [Leptospiraceae bacterium]